MAKVISSYAMKREAELAGDRFKMLGILRM